MSSSASEQGRVVAGRYRILRPLGSGAHGVVDLAEDLLAGGRRVALKRLEGIVGAGDPEPAAETLRWFQHPRWAEILDEGRLDDHGRFQVTRYIPGHSLDKVELPLPPSEVVRFLEDGARVLGALHGRGLVHYDVTPGNWIREERDGGPVFTLTDGGLASVGPVRGIARGTPLFMAPEVVEGAPHDHRADLYALGLVAYRLLTATDPFRGGAGEVLGKRRREAAPLVRLRRPDVPVALERILASLLEREPDRRPADGAGLLALLAAEGCDVGAEVLPEEAVAIASSGRLVGRTALLARFREACRALLTTAPTRTPGDEILQTHDRPPTPDLVLAWHGPSGCGGSRALREMAAVTRAEGVPLLVLSGREGAADRRHPLRRLSEALAHLGGEAGNGHLNAASDPRSARAENGAREAEPWGPRAFERLVDLCERVSSRTPFVVLLEDFAELPATAQEGLRVLARHLLTRAEHPDGRRPPRLLLGIDHGPEDPGALLIPDAAEPRRPCIALDGLDDEALRALLAERFPGLEPPPDDLRAIREVSEGLPRQVVSLLSQGLRRGDVRREAGRWIWVTDSIASYPLPRSLPPEVARSLDAAPPVVRDVVAAIAMLDSPAPESLVMALAGPEAVVGLASCPLLTRSHEGAQTRWAPASRGLRDVLRAGDKADVEAARVRLLTALRSLDLPELAPDEARLVLETGDPRSAFEALTAAAPRLPAHARGRAATVLQSIARAAPDTIATPEARRAAARLIGTAPEAAPLAEILHGALPLRIDAADLETAAELASYGYNARRYDRAINLGERAAHLPLGDPQTAVALARLRVSHARSHLAAKPLPGARGLVLNSLRAVRAMGLAARRSERSTVTSALLGSARLRITSHQYARARGINRRALRTARRGHELFLAAQAYNNLAVCLQHIGQTAEAEQAIGRCVRIRMALGDLQGAVGNLHNLARLKQLRGATLEAAALHSRAVGLGSRFAHHTGVALSLAALAEIYDSQRNPRLAIAALLRARDVARANRDAPQSVAAARAAAALLALTGDATRARELLAESGRHARRASTPAARDAHREALATVTFLFGDHARAARMLSRCEEPPNSDAASTILQAVQLVQLLGRGPQVRRRPGAGYHAPRQTEFRLALAEVARYARHVDASTPARLSELLGRSQTGRAQALTGTDIRILQEVLLAALGEVSRDAASDRTILDQISRIASAQDFHVVHARAAALRALHALQRSQLAAASHELTSGLSALNRGLHGHGQYTQPQPARSIPPEFRAVLGALESRHGTEAKAQISARDFWTRLHASAHMLVLESGAAALPDTRLQTALRTILAVSARLKTGAGLEALLESLNSYAREITKAEHTCIVLLNANGSRDVRIASSSSVHPSHAGLARVSHTVMQRVLTGRTPLLLHDVFGDSELMERPSIVSLSLRSVLCVPMIRGDQLYGAMYADSSSGAGSFDKVDLEILSLFAEQAAAAIETSRLLVDVQRSYTELKAAQERLIRGERLRVMGEMTSGVAHEFNNLLTAILARIQLLNLDYLTDETRESLHLIEKAALDAAGVVRRLQGFTRSQRQADFQRVDLAEVCADVIELLRPLWSTRRSAGRPAITVRLRASRGLYVRGDATELREVLTNLLKNALDALERGGAIQIAAEVRGGRIRVEVVDDGPGIAKEQQAKLFTPFFTTKGERGTGLGLCLSQQIVERHGGELRISSEVGHGTSAVFDLPEAGASFTADGPQLPATLPVENTRPVSVVVVDDDPDVLTPLCGYLQKSGFEVRGAASASDALAAVGTVQPDVLISDIAMPGMDGLELCRRLKRNHPSLPVVLMTGRASDIDPVQAHKTGAAALLPKPFTMRQVIELLARLARSSTGQT